MREAESVSFQGKTKAGQAAEGLERWGCSAEDHCLGLSRLLEPGGALMHHPRWSGSGSLVNLPSRYSVSLFPYPSPKSEENHKVTWEGSQPPGSFCKLSGNSSGITVGDPTCLCHLHIPPPFFPIVRHPGSRLVNLGTEILF